jgi:mannose-6-phosphate isomerase-like protein (cupin superfamily)
MRHLAALVGDVEDFERDVWGVRPLRTGAPDSPAVAPLTLVDVDRLITSALRVPAIRLVRAGERIPTADYCTPTRIGSTSLTDVADAHKVLDEYRRGATIVLQSLHRTSAPVSAWCADLEADLGWPVQCNAYLTPPHTAGLRRHADGHDVFVVQTHGSKRWDVDGLGELTLRVGEVLYLPAGVEHDASTVREPSLHLTVGIHRPDPERLVRSALDRLDLSAAPVPIGSSASLTNAVADAMRHAAAGLAEVDPEAVGQAVRRPARRHPGGIIEAAVRRDPLDDHSTIRLTPGATASLDVVDERLRCSWPDGTLWMPRHVEAAMRVIVTCSGGRSVSIGDLPGLDASDRLVLVRRLADEGLVVGGVAVGPDAPRDGNSSGN